LLLGVSLLRRQNAIKALILQIEWLMLQIERVGWGGWRQHASRLCWD